MQYDIKRIVKWCETWSMEFGLSPEKCKIMHVGKQTNPEEFFIAGKKIAVTDVKEIWVFSSRLMARSKNKSTLQHQKQTRF